MASDVIQVLMSEVLADDLERWLASRGLLLVRTPFLDDSDGEGLSTYTVVPSDEALRAAGMKIPEGES